MRLLTLVLFKMLLSGAVLAPPTDISTVKAEERSYGEVFLNGLARDNVWPYNPAGLSYAMVCNVSGPDGFLSIRSGPSTQYEVQRRLERLAIVEVDTTNIRGNWIRVIDAHRTHTPEGQPQDYLDLHVEGWAHTGYLCDFIS